MQTRRNLCAFILLLLPIALMPAAWALQSQNGSISMLLYGPNDLAAGPIMAFMSAFAITVFIELFVAYVLISFWRADDQLLIWVIIANTLSWPFLILFAPVLDSVFGDTGGFAMGVAATTFVEGLVLYAASPRALGLKRAILLSIATNLSSAAVSILLTRLFSPVLYY